MKKHWKNDFIYVIINFDWVICKDAQTLYSFGGEKYSISAMQSLKFRRLVHEKSATDRNRFA